jgi:hypothetical protein
MKGTKKRTWKLNWYILTITEVFHNQKRINVSRHTVKMAPCEVSSKSNQGEEQKHFSSLPVPLPVCSYSKLPWFHLYCEFT